MLCQCGPNAEASSDKTGIPPLEATGLPLELFSHTMQSAASCHLMPGSALPVVSRGIIEADYGNADHQSAEFGLDAVKQSFQHANCAQRERTVHDRFAGGSEVHTDDAHTQRSNLTTLVLVRTASGDHDAV